MPSIPFLDSCPKLEIYIIKPIETASKPIRAAKIAKSLTILSESIESIIFNAATNAKIDKPNDKIISPTPTKPSPEFRNTSPPNPFLEIWGKENAWL